MQSLYNKTLTGEDIFAMLAKAEVEAKWVWTDGKTSVDLLDTSNIKPIGATAMGNPILMPTAEQFEKVDALTHTLVITVKNLPVDVPPPMLTWDPPMNRTDNTACIAMLSRYGWVAISEETIPFKVFSQKRQPVDMFGKKIAQPEQPVPNYAPYLLYNRRDVAKTDYDIVGLSGFSGEDWFRDTFWTPFKKHAHARAEEITWTRGKAIIARGFFGDLFREWPAIFQHDQNHPRANYRQDVALSYSDFTDDGLSERREKEVLPQKHHFKKFAIGPSETTASSQGQPVENFPNYKLVLFETPALWEWKNGNTWQISMGMYEHTDDIKLFDAAPLMKGGPPTVLNAMARINLDWPLSSDQWKAMAKAALGRLKTQPTQGTPTMLHLDPRDACLDDDYRHINIDQPFFLASVGNLDGVTAVFGSPIDFSSTEPATIALAQNGTTQRYAVMKKGVTVVPDGIFWKFTPQVSTGDSTWTAYDSFVKLELTSEGPGYAWDFVYGARRSQTAPANVDTTGLYGKSGTLEVYLVKKNEKAFLSGLPLPYYVTNYGKKDVTFTPETVSGMAAVTSVSLDSVPLTTYGHFMADPTAPTVQVKINDPGNEVAKVRLWVSTYNGRCLAQGVDTSVPQPLSGKAYEYDSNTTGGHRVIGTDWQTLLWVRDTDGIILPRLTGYKSKYASYDQVLPREDAAFVYSTDAESVRVVYEAVPDKDGTATFKCNPVIFTVRAGRHMMEVGLFDKNDALLEGGSLRLEWMSIMPGHDGKTPPPEIDPTSLTYCMLPWLLKDSPVIPLKSVYMRPLVPGDEIRLGTLKPVSPFAKVEAYWTLDGSEVSVRLPGVPIVEKPWWTKTPGSVPYFNTDGIHVDPGVLNKITHDSMGNPSGTNVTIGTGIQWKAMWDAYVDKITKEYHFDFDTYRAALWPHTQFRIPLVDQLTVQLLSVGSGTMRFIITNPDGTFSKPVEVSGLQFMMGSESPVLTPPGTGTGTDPPGTGTDPPSGTKHAPLNWAMPAPANLTKQVDKDSWTWSLVLGSAAEAFANKQDPGWYPHVINFYGSIQAAVESPIPQNLAVVALNYADIAGVATTDGFMPKGAPSLIKFYV